MGRASTPRFQVGTTRVIATQKAPCGAGLTATTTGVLEEAMKAEARRQLSRTLQDHTNNCSNCKRST